jgi:phosphohistidine phosphatase SixA
MLLYIVRHAWAEERDDSKWPGDLQRPLTDKGQKRFAQVVKKLVEADFEPAVIATSPLARCRQTAELIAERVTGKPSIVPLDALAPGSDLTAMLKWTREQAESDVAWVGHSPDVEIMAAHLMGGGDSALRFAKGAVAAIEFEGQIEPQRGELQWLATAKLLGV